MDKNNQYGTLVEALEQLKKKGYTHYFQVNEQGQLTEDKKAFFLPSDVELHEFHRFEGNTNPADMSILYAVQTSTGLKGTVVDAYGADGSEVISEFMNQANRKQFDS
jgi:hypothetical protein